MQPTNYRSDSSDTIAMVVEILFGLFGILGMGWLYAGNIGISLLVFFGFAVVVFIETFVASITFGIAACVIIPLNIAIAVISGMRARDYVRNSGAKGSVVYLLIGLVVGGAVICGGIFLLLMLGGALEAL